MKLSRYLLSLSLLVTSVTAFAASTFEGKVDFAIATDGRNNASQAMSYAIKGPLMRMEITADGQQMASIIDGNKQEMVMLMPEQKMYMTMSIKSAVNAAANTADVDPNLKIERTGKTETILGYKCEQVIVTDKDSTTEVWLAQGLGSFVGLGAGQGGPFGAGKKQANNQWEKAIKESDGFPLRVISRNKKAKEIFKMEATKIAPGSLPDSLFQPPSDYQKFAMPGMGGFNPFKK